jgi:adenine phosphoribosyltransferase
MNLKDTIRTVPNWPVEGVMFRDITTLLQDPDAFQQAINRFYERYKDEKIDKVVGIDARGFIFGAVLAYKLKVGFVLVRKKGKLPYKTIEAQYSLEYGTSAIEIHEDSIQTGDRVLIMDDLLATGGTVAATAKLVEKLGGEIVECAFLINLPDLKGSEKIKHYTLFALTEFEGE